MAVPWGYGAQFRTPSPCCSRSSIIDAAIWAGTGKQVTCAGCGWKWDVYLADGSTRLPQLPRDARHPDIRAGRAEWVSAGSGVRKLRRKDRLARYREEEESR